MSKSTCSARRPSVWSLRTFCLITGASRGYGQRAAVRFAARLPPGSALLLTARDAAGLAATRAAVTAARPEVKVETWSVDLAVVTGEEVALQLREAAPRLGDFQQAVLVHNAATIGDISCLTVEQTDAQMMGEFWRVNLTSMLIINSAFWQRFSATDVTSRLIVHVTSICAKQPFKSFSLYCAAKAARNMLMCTLAEEDPTMRVLNYAPGPLDTDMQAEVRQRAGDTELRDMFKAMHEEGRLLTPDQSLDALLYLLDKNSFESGAHIDYYDIDLPPPDEPNMIHDPSNGSGVGSGMVNSSQTVESFRDAELQASSPLCGDAISGKTT